MEVMGLMLGVSVDDYTVRVIPLPDDDEKAQMDEIVQPGLQEVCYSSGTHRTLRIHEYVFPPPQYFWPDVESWERKRDHAVDAVRDVRGEYESGHHSTLF